MLMQQHPTYATRQANYAIDPIYVQRWSPRSFDSRPVPEDVLLAVLEAARWAPSGGNVQPWRFVVAQTEEERAVFGTFVNESNWVWCSKAPVLLLLASATINARGTLHGAHAFDAGTAWGFMSLEAARHGLVTHAMGGYNKELAAQKLGLPDDVQPQVVIALGYQGDKEALPEPLQQRETPSDRKPMQDIAFRGTFGQSL